MSSMPPKEQAILPTGEQVRRAVGLYLDHAYGGEVPQGEKRLIPADGFDPPAWLMSGVVERDPANAPLANVRSFALRLGNCVYPNMKLRLSRPPNDPVYVFSVDSHDVFLTAAANSPDYAALEELKRANAAMASAITAAWDAAGLLTDKNYLRQKIQQAKEGSGG